MRTTILAFAAAVGLAASSCDHPIQQPEPHARLAFSVTYANTVAGSVNRIRLTPTAGNVALPVAQLDVNPADPSWEVTLEVESGIKEVVVLIELIERTNGVDNVLYSARTAPIKVTPGKTETTAVTQLGVGDIANSTVSSVSITPKGSQLVEGSTTNLIATVTGGGGGAHAIFTSLNPNIATVSADGVVTGILPGTARVYAAAGARADTVTITILQKLARVVLNPTSGSAASFGEVLNFTATPQDPRNTNFTGATVTWATSNANVLESNGNGKFTAKANGTATVTTTATSGSVTVNATASVTVSQKVATVVIGPPSSTINVGGTTQLTSSSKDALGNTVNLGVTWSSTDPAIATVNGVGTVTGVKAGTTTINASLQGVTAAPVTIIVQNVQQTFPNITGTYDMTAVVSGHSDESMSGTFVIRNQVGGNAEILISLVAIKNGVPYLAAQNEPTTVSVTSAGRITMTFTSPGGRDSFSFDGSLTTFGFAATWGANSPDIPDTHIRNGTLSAVKR